MNEQEAMDRAIEECTGVRIFRMNPSYLEDYKRIERARTSQPWYARFDNNRKKKKRR